MKRNLLITGGAGYIGSHIVLEIAKKHLDYNVIVFDNLLNGNLKALELIKKAYNFDYKFYKGNLLVKEDIQKVFLENQIDSVLHMAGFIEAGKSVVTPLKFYENNVSGSINLFLEMQKNNVRKIIFSSTASLYDPKDLKLSEEKDNVVSTGNSYADSKFMVENMLRAMSKEGVDPAEKINSVILRYFNACGNDEDLLIGQDYPNPTHLITVAIETALGFREKLTIFGGDYDTPDGTCNRDYIHVADLASAHIKALQYLDTLNGNDIFNIGTTVATSNLQVVSLLEEIAGKFNWSIGERRVGDSAFSVANSTKAMNVLNWKPKYTVKDSIVHAYNWKKKYPKGYTEIKI